MAFQRHLIRALAVLTALLLVSCIDGREEIWLNADGSGHADFNYSFPASAARFQGGVDGVRKMIKDFLAESKELNSSMSEVTLDQDRIQVHVQVAVDSLDDLAALALSPEGLKKLPPAAEGLAGKFEISTKGRHLGFSRTVEVSKTLPGSLFMPASKFAGHNLVYILHLPQLTDEHNATRVEDGGKTLIWETPLAQALKKPVVIRFKATVPFPRSWIAVACAAALVILALAGLGVMKWRRRLKKLMVDGKRQRATLRSVSDKSKLYRSGKEED